MTVKSQNRPEPRTAMISLSTKGDIQCNGSIITWILHQIFTPATNEMTNIEFHFGNLD